jgi:hypothetical protein
MKLRRAAIAATVVAASGGVAWAAVPDSGGTIRGCYDDVPGQRTLYVLESGESCQKNQVSIAWNQSGPAGPQGPVGATGAPGAAGTGAPSAASGLELAYYAVVDYGPGYHRSNQPNSMVMTRSSAGVAYRFQPSYAISEFHFSVRAPYDLRFCIPVVTGFHTLHDRLSPASDNDDSPWLGNDNSWGPTPLEAFLDPSEPDALRVVARFSYTQPTSLVVARPFVLSVFCPPGTSAGQGVVAPPSRPRAGVPSQTAAFLLPGYRGLGRLDARPGKGPFVTPKAPAVAR